MIRVNHPELSIAAQCRLLEIHRSGWYYEPVPESADNLRIMRLLDEQYLKTPYYGVRRMQVMLQRQGWLVNHKRIGRLMKLMGLEAIYPKPNLSKPDKRAYIYPYLLRDLEINSVNQAWATDITYIPMPNGYLYLSAIIDLYSRYVVAWSISNTMEAAWVASLVREAIAAHGKPQIINSDQGSQYTSEEYIALLKQEQIVISMDGKGRAIDNIFIERLWRSVKYEYVYLQYPQTGMELHRGLKTWFDEYNTERPHQSLDNRTPIELYQNKAA